MKRGHYFSALLVTLLTALLSACGSSKTSTTVNLAPTGASVVLGGTQQFSATVSGPSDTTVSWSVGGTGCSGSGCGTIDSNGLYTAPSQMPSSSTVNVTATSNGDPSATATAVVTLDSGVRVQISPDTATLASNEQFNFSATVTGTTNTQVTWAVNGTPNGDPSEGQICVLNSNPCQTPTGPANAVTFLAPSTVVGTLQAKVAAISVADSAQQATSSVTIMPEVSPVVASISPPSTTQGAVMQDVYVTAQSPSNFFSTSTVLANGQAVPTTFIDNTLIRGRLPRSVMQAGGTVQIAVREQNGQISNSIGLPVTAVSPAVISFSPVSVPQCPTGSCGPSSVTLDGGYFSSSTSVSFNGQPVGATLNGANQISVSLPGSALQTAGLYQLTLNNSTTQPLQSAVNVAVEPAASANPPTTLATVTVGQGPSAVAVDASTGVAVVVNSTDNSISLIDLTGCSGGSCPVIATVPVGHDPTGVAVDPVRHLAIVVNQGDNSLSLMDLSSATYTTQTLALPAGYVPVSIGENPLTGHALIANQSTNTVTVADLTQSPVVFTSVDVTEGGTRSGGTGLSPRVAIEPRLDWAIVTPGGAGAISAIDMSHPIISPVTAQPTFNVVFSFISSTTVTGIALNNSTDQLLLADPNTNVAGIFSLLNESLTNVSNAGSGNVATAVNNLTDVGVLANQLTNTIQFIDMRNSQIIGSPMSVGTKPVDVAVDQVSDEAVVVNQNDSTVSVISLGTVRSLAVTQASVSQLLTSSSSQQVTLIGGGFASTSVVRVDGTPLAAGNVQFVSSRVINVSIPGSWLTGPRILNLDVQDSSSDLSNVFQIPVVQVVPVGNAPVGVAVDSAANLAAVSNSGSNTVSLIDLSNGTVVATVDVGSSPQGIAVLPRLGHAVVANNGDNSASLIDYSTLSSSTPTPVVGGVTLTSVAGNAQGPIAVDIDPDSGAAAIANQQSSNVSFASALTGSFFSQLVVDTGPIGVAMDSNIQMTGVLCSTQSPPTIVIADLQAGIETNPAVISGHITGANLPTGIALDPVNDLFLVADSTGNRILVIDPQNNKTTQNIGTGINPTSIAYNFNALEALTVNTGSHSASLVEVTPNGSYVRALLPAEGSSLQSVAINPLTNVAVVADQAHNQVLLMPLAH